MERERRKFKLPVEVDEDGFAIDEKRLDESLHRRMDEIAEQKVEESRSGLRMFMASILAIFVVGAIIVFAMRGALIFSFILVLAIIFNASGLANWIEGKDAMNLM